MKQSKDQYYFETMARCAQFGLDAAKHLKAALATFG